MADLTTNNTNLQTRAAGGRASFPIANTVTLGVGALVQLESGYLNHWDETGQFMGVVVGGDFNTSTGLLTGNTSADIPPEATVDISGAILTHLDSITGLDNQNDVGDLVYSADSDPASLTLTDTTNPPVGFVVRFTSDTDGDVKLFTPGEHLAGVASGTWLA